MMTFEDFMNNWIDDCVRAQDMDDYYKLFHKAQEYIHNEARKGFISLKKVEEIWKGCWCEDEYEQDIFDEQLFLNKIEEIKEVGNE